jgi:hypothetical protein
LLSISAGANARYALFADFLKAIEINPRHAEAFLGRCILYSVNGERDRAISGIRQRDRSQTLRRSRRREESSGDDVAGLDVSFKRTSVCVVDDGCVGDGGHARAFAAVEESAFPSKTTKASFCYLGSK